MTEDDVPQITMGKPPPNSFSKCPLSQTEVDERLIHVLKALLLGHELLPTRHNARVLHEVRPAPLPRIERAQPELLVQHAMERR